MPEQKMSQDETFFYAPVHVLGEDRNIISLDPATGVSHNGVPLGTGGSNSTASGVSIDTSVKKVVLDSKKPTGARKYSVHRHPSSTKIPTFRSK